METTNSSDQIENMEIDLSISEWLEKIKLIMEEERDTPRYILEPKRYLTGARVGPFPRPEVYVPFSNYKDYEYLNEYDSHTSDDDDYDGDDDHDDDYFENKNLCIYMRYDKNRKKLDSFDMILLRLAPLFVSHPQLAQVCKNKDNKFVESCFTKYEFARTSRYLPHQLIEKSINTEYLINLWGSKLTSLCIIDYPSSQILPLISSTCRNLEDFSFRIKEMKSEDFQNVFSNMSRLKILSISWENEYSTMPDTLINSLEHVSGTLMELNLTSDISSKLFVLDSLASVLPRFVILKYLFISHYQLSQQIIQSISEIKSLEDLTIISMEKHDMLDKNFNLDSIKNLKNLKQLSLDVNYGVTDEFINNLCNNVQKSTCLKIREKCLTDYGRRRLEIFKNKKDKSEMDLSLFDNSKDIRSLILGNTIFYTPSY